MKDVGRDAVSGSDDKNPLVNFDLRLDELVQVVPMCREKPILTLEDINAGYNP